MKKLFCYFLLISLSVSAQKRNNFNFEIKGNTYTGIGNNYIADGTGTFTGFGIGLGFFVFKNFGLGFEFNNAYGKVKDPSVFGELRSPQWSSGEIYAFYRHPFSERFDAEGFIGSGFHSMVSKSNYSSKDFREGGSSFLLGAKALYRISSNKKVYVFASPKFYFLTNFTEMDDSAVQKYYAEPTLFNFSLGLRFYL